MPVSVTFGYWTIYLALLYATGSGAFTGSGPFAELLLVNSLEPWANRHLSPYLHWPFSLQFLHISYLRRRTTGYGVAVAAAAVVPLESCDEFLSTLEFVVAPATARDDEPPCFTSSFFSEGVALSREEFVPLSDWDEGFPKLCSPSGYLCCCYG